MIDIQHCIAIMGGREVSRPYRFCFFMFLFQPPSIYPLSRHHPPHSTILPHPEKTYENRFTNTNNHPQFIQIISKLQKLQFFLNGENSWREQAFVNASFLILKIKCKTFFCSKMDYLNFLINFTSWYNFSQLNPINYHITNAKKRLF